MNKFQELQAKAFELCNKHEDEGKSVVMTDEWLRIYSELIVEECGNVADDSVEIGSPSNNIDRHFGIHIDTKFSSLN
jgi:hypothetical protein